MKLSIIIVSYNVRRDLIDCLNSIRENQSGLDYEIIVVDNASTDGTVEVVKKDFPKVIIIANGENRGFSAANNQAIKIAKGQYLFLLNPDTTVHPRSLDKLVEVLDKNPDAGACGPAFIEANGVICPSVGYVPTFRALLYRKTFFRSLGIFRRHYQQLAADKLDSGMQADVEQISGAAIMVRSSVMDEIGLMDESFFLYYEDVDLCLRIRKAGWRIIYTPEAMITHAVGRSTSQITTGRNMILHKSMFIYLRKHRGGPATLLFSLIYKPAVIAKELSNLLAGAVTFIVSILLLNRKRRMKSGGKIMNSVIFFQRYLLQFLFRT